MWAMAHLLVARPPTPVTMLGFGTLPLWENAYCAYAGVSLVLRGSPGARIAWFGTPPILPPLLHMDGETGTGESY